MEWKHPASLKKNKNQKKSKSQASAGKVMQLLFWDCNGLVLELYVQQGTTVTAASYTEILKSRLKPEICNKVQRFAVQGDLLPCNNACLHSATASVEEIRQLKFEFLPCPTYSLDLAPLDYHMFGPIK